MSKEALEKISPFLDAANVDLKSFSEDFYVNNCRAHLQPVLDSIKRMKEMGIWVEVTTLLVPGENDSDDELAKIAKFITSLGREIPWHISRFHPNYKFMNHHPTSTEILHQAQKIGQEAGLRYIYLGNVTEGSDTFCHSCRRLLIKRLYFDICENNIDSGICSFCQAAVDGVFSE